MHTWTGRFDDPRSSLPPAHRFRTVYLAQDRLTAFAEVLQNLRPATAEIARFAALFGAPPPAPIVPSGWRADRRLARTRVNLDPAEVVDLDDLAVRAHLEAQHARLLATHGMRNLDLSQLRSPQRIVTQTIALDLWTQGRRALLYTSHLTDRPCLAWFERIDQDAPPAYGAAREIAADDPDLVELCATWKLRIET